MHKVPVVGRFLRETGGVSSLVKEDDRISRRVSELNKRRRAAVEAGDTAAVKQIEDQIKTTAALFNDRGRSRVPE